MGVVLFDLEYTQESSMPKKQEFDYKAFESLTGKDLVFLHKKNYRNNR
jgi:hypothetical protein